MFRLSDAMNTVDKFVTFIAGIAPSATHRLHRSVLRRHRIAQVHRLASPVIWPPVWWRPGVEDSARTWARLRCSYFHQFDILTAASMFGSVYGAEIATSTESQAAIAGPLHKSTIVGGNTGTAVSQDGTELLVGST